MLTSGARVPRCFFALAIVVALAGAPAAAVEPASTGMETVATDAAFAETASEPSPQDISPDLYARSDALPLAPAGALRFPRSYPCLELGIGLRNFNPDLSGLAEIYGGTPSFGLSPIICGVVELAFSDFLAFQLDAGVSIGDDSSSGNQGLAGICVRPRFLSSADFRFGLSGGVAVGWFEGKSGGIGVAGGASGYYACAELERRLDADYALELYGGYSSYPRVSTDYTNYTDPEPEVLHASVELSEVIVGLRLKGRVWERWP